MSDQDFQLMTLGQLRAYARSVGLVPKSHQRRSELEAAIVQHVKKSAQAERAAAHRSYVESVPATGRQ